MLVGSADDGIWVYVDYGHKEHDDGDINLHIISDGVPLTVCIHGAVPLEKLNDVIIEASNNFKEWHTRFVELSPMIEADTQWILGPRKSAEALASDMGLSNWRCIDGPFYPTMQDLGVRRDILATPDFESLPNHEALLSNAVYALEQVYLWRDSIQKCNCEPDWERWERE